MGSGLESGLGAFELVPVQENLIVPKSVDLDRSLGETGVLGVEREQVDGIRIPLRDIGDPGGLLERSE